MNCAKVIPFLKRGSGLQTTALLAPFVPPTVKHSSSATEATFNTCEYKLHKLCEGPASSSTVTRDEALHCYTQMQTIRTLELAIDNLCVEKMTRGPIHLNNGQEAICVGTASALKPVDNVITSYRDHGWFFVLGGTVLSIIGECLGKKSGCSRGKGGSMHLYGERFFGGHGITGAQVSLGTGLAFSSKYLDTGGVCIILYGDGAANQGQIFEAYNMAKLWKLPAVFVCENNGYGFCTPTDRHSASASYYTRGDYVPGIWVDGMDVLSVKEAVRFAVDHCKADRGPIVLEAATFYFKYHSFAFQDTSLQRQRLLRDWQRRDPIQLFKEKSVSAGLVTGEELEKIDGEVRKEVDDALKLAKADKEIPVQELAADVYYNPIETRIRGVLPSAPYQHQRIATPFNAH